MVSLQDICLHITDGKHGDCQSEEGSGYYFISCKDVKDGWIDYSSARQITETDYHDTHRRTQLGPNDILITNSGTIGRIALVPNTPKTRRTTFQKSVAIIKPNQETLSPEWLYYYLLAKKDALVELAGGTAQKNLLLKDLRAFQINLPPFPTQLKIAAILSPYDDLIDNNVTRIKVLEEIAENLYNEWFVDLRFPGHENVEIVQTPYGSSPDGWKPTTIGNAFRTVLGGTPSRAKAEYWKEGTIPWVNSSKTNEIRVMTPTERITELGLQKSSTKLMPKRTTLVAITGATLGQVSLSEIEVCANQSVVGIFDPSGNYSEWIYLEMSNKIQEIIQKASGGAQQHINKQIVDETKILLPSSEFMGKFIQIAKPIFDLICLLLRKDIVLREMRDLLLSDLVSGEINVNQANIGLFR